MKKAVVYGLGHCGSVVAKQLKSGLIDGVELVGVWSYTTSKAEAYAKELNVFHAKTIDELLALKPDYFIETAKGFALKEIAVKVLSAGTDLLVLSTGAFSDEAFYNEVLETAEKYDRHVYLIPGAVGGFDIFGAAKLMGKIESATFEKEIRVDLMEEYGGNMQQIYNANSFEGFAKDGYEKAPNMLNVAVSTGLATIGPEKLPAKVYPGDKVDFTLTAEGEFGKTKIYTEFGPRGVEFVAYSILYILQRLNSRITF